MLIVVWSFVLLTELTSRTSHFHFHSGRFLLFRKVQKSLFYSCLAPIMKSSWWNIVLGNAQWAPFFILFPCDFIFISVYRTFIHPYEIRHFVREPPRPGHRWSNNQVTPSSGDMHVIPSMPIIATPPRQHPRTPNTNMGYSNGNLPLNSWKSSKVLMDMYLQISHIQMSDLRAMVSSSPTWDGPHRSEAAPFGPVFHVRV